MRALKFGGTSVGNAERMRGVAEIVGQQAPEGPLVVVGSAVGGVTDALLKGAEQAAAGGSVVPALARFHSLHRLNGPGTLSGHPGAEPSCGTRRG